MHCLEVLERTRDLLLGLHLMSQFCRFVATRFLLAIVTLLIVTFIVFSLMELTGSSARCTSEIIRFVALHENYVIRWIIWVSDIFLHGDFGFACVARQQITDLIGARFWI